MKHLASFILLMALPTTSLGFSAVFSGDPISPSTSAPYQVMPGFPLVEAGVDGILGTTDDVISPAIIGDIDMVVRSGSPAATAIIAPPLIQSGRAAVPVGVAGSPAAAGTAIPFTVFLSDGVTDAGAPSGHLLTTADMNDMPVVVAAFADYDGDGFIGPTDLDSSGATDNPAEVRELEAVGRAVAMFSGGVARGAVAVQVGLPPSHGGLSILLAALALTGPFAPGFYDSEVPSGPAISTALPFLPQTDLQRLFRDRAVAVNPDTTLQQVIRFAALPSAAAPALLALPLSGSSLTVDVAVVYSQSAIRAGLFENTEPLGARRQVDSVVLGNRSKAARRVFRLMPTDRWGNPADPLPAMTAAVVSSDPMKTAKPRGNTELTTPDGVEVKLKVRNRVNNSTSGSIAVEVGGVVVDSATFTVDERYNLRRADALVPSPETPTIQSAIATVTDKRRDGVLVIAIAPGVYRENLVVNRDVVLRGDGSGSTIIQGDGSSDTMTISATGVTVVGVTVSGGAAGIAVNADDVELVDVAVWRNVGAGAHLNGNTTALSRLRAGDNGSHGLEITGDDVTCTDARLTDNLGSGATLTSTTRSTITTSQLVGNNAGGVIIIGGSAAAIDGNQFANNVGSGIETDLSSANHIVGNLVVLNDEDGLSTDHSSANFISANVFESNNGYGMFIRRSDGSDDFASAAGIQTPVGDNSSSDNRKGNLFVRPD